MIKQTVTFTNLMCVTKIACGILNDIVDSHCTFQSWENNERIEYSECPSLNLCIYKIKCIDQGHLCIDKI